MKINKSFLIGLIITILLLGGVIVAFYLSQQTQDVRQRAAEGTTGPFGKAVVFDGSTTQIYIGSSSAATLPVTSSPFSISMWIKPEYLAPEPESQSRFILDSNVLSNPNPDCKDEISLFITPSGQSVTEYSIFAKATTAADQQTTVGLPNFTLPYDKWSHIVFSVDAGGNAKLFSNGHLIDSTALPRNLCLNPNNSFYLGSGAWPHTSTHFKGQIDELHFSNESIDTDVTNVPTAPGTVTANTTGLYHFDDNLSDEFSAVDAFSLGSVTYVDSTVVSTTTPPVCQSTLSACSWDPVDSAVSYHYKITEEGKDVPIAEADVQAPTTSTSFTSEANKTYTCEVTASSACGVGPKGSATTTCSVLPTPTVPVPTPTTPVATPTVPAPTPTTSVPTPTTPVATPTVPAPTPTTSVPTPTTPVPTATTAPVAANTPIPGVPTNSPTPTIASPGSPIETFAIAGGIFLTIIGALLLFAL